MLPKFDLDDCIELTQGIEQNGQTWERMKCLIVTSRHGLLNWYPTFLLYAFSLSVLDLQFGIQLYFYNAVFHVVECGLEADQVSNFITRIQVNRIELQLFVAFAQK